MVFFLEECGQLCKGAINKPGTIYGTHLLRGRLFYKVLFLKDSSSILVVLERKLLCLFGGGNGAELR